MDLVAAASVLQAKRSWELRARGSWGFYKLGDRASKVV